MTVLVSKEYTALESLPVVGAHEEGAGEWRAAEAGRLKLHCPQGFGESVLQPRLEEA